MSIFAGGRAETARRLACANEPQLFDEDIDGIRESGAELLARYREAVELCWSCPIRMACLTEAMTWPEDDQYGIRGGKTAAQRRTAIRRRRRAEAAVVEQGRRELSLALTGGAR